MILSRSLLNPILHQIQDPFASIVECVEKWLTKFQPSYLVEESKSTWPTIKHEYIKRLLRLAKNGSALRGHAHLAPTADLNTALLDIYQLLDHCVYFTSQYWRAFYYWLKTGKLNPAWPQFSEREALLAYSLLTQDEIAYLRIEAEKEWVDFSADKELLTNLFKKIRRPVYRICYKKAGFLQEYDPALYSLADIQQYAMESVLASIRNNDHLSRSLDWLIRWSIRCADNAVLNLINKATAKKRNKALEEDERSSVQFCGNLYRHRECYLSLAPYASPANCSGEQYQAGDQDSYGRQAVAFTLLDSLQLLGNQPFKDAETIENNLCLKELLKLADPKINSYLRTICGGEHNAEFWSWFYYNEPTLAQRLAYIEENPEALGPYLQRHLDLPTYQLTSFLRQHIPSLLERVSKTPSNQAMLAYA